MFNIEKNRIFKMMLFSNKISVIKFDFQEEIFFNEYDAFKFS